MSITGFHPEEIPYPRAMQDQAIVVTGASPAIVPIHEIGRDEDGLPFFRGPDPS